MQRKFQNQITDLLVQARQRNHRLCIVLAGNKPWVQLTLSSILTLIPGYSVHWVRKNENLLGGETSTLVYDAFAGFNPDTFGAVSGTLRGGGLMILLTPPLADWPRFNDPEYQRITVYPVTADQMTGRFLQRLVNVLKSHKETFILEENGPEENNTPELSDSCPLSKVIFTHPIFRTPDQQLAVEAIWKVVTGHRRRPLVITSDRGRGKSAALGIAAAQLMEECNDPKGNPILLTAPCMDAVDIVFQHAASCLNNANVSRGLITTATGRFEFLPPDELIRHEHKARLLLVDEAAAIPAPLLARLLERYSRIVFATTIHGYEGTGRGFAIRFQQVLDEQTPRWKTLSLESPVRWAAKDPLEDMVFKALLLEARPADDQALGSIQRDACELELLDRQQLLNDEPTLRQLFGLLINAHYQTRPSDLRYLLDGPNLSIFVLRNQVDIIATALIAKEGGFDETLSREISAGKRRPHGHLIPETLASHMGLDQAPLLHGARVLRIAVHPVLQQQGWGTDLLDKLQYHSTLSDVDYLAACFGATSRLLRFWKNADYLPVRIGIQRNASSGEHSVVVIRPLSQQGDDLFKLARERFFTHLPHQLAEPLRDLEPALVTDLIIRDQHMLADLNTMDWNDLIAFASGQRVYEACPAPIWKFTCAALMCNRSRAFSDDLQQAVLISKILQKQDWQKVAQLTGLSGKKAVIKVLRGVLLKLLQGLGKQ